MSLKRKRSKTMIALLLPVIICVFVAGWIMYCVGGSKPVQTKPVGLYNQRVGYVK